MRKSFYYPVPSIRKGLLIILLDGTGARLTMKEFAALLRFSFSLPAPMVLPVTYLREIGTLTCWCSYLGLAL